MLFISYENYKGGVNNLCVAFDSDTGLKATSIHGKYAAVQNLNRKIDKAGGYWKTRQQEQLK